MLVAYTTSLKLAAVQAGEDLDAQISSFIAETNEILARSAVNAEVVLRGLAETNYSETGVLELAERNCGVRYCRGWRFIGAFGSHAGVGQVRK